MTKACCRGFTLIEVMLALLIFSLVAATVIKSTSSAVQRQSALEERMMASWIAANHLTQARLQSKVVPGRKKEQVDFGGRKWTVTREVLGTPNPFIFEIRVQVSAVSDTEQAVQTYTVSGYKGTH